MILPERRTTNDLRESAALRLALGPERDPTELTIAPVATAFRRSGRDALSGD
jgi:hypothetical protein